MIPDKSSYWNKFIRKDECKIIGTENVLSTTIDDFAKEEKINFDFIKSDTEGYDLNVLRGGDETMKRVLGVRCEVHFANNFKGGSNFSEIHEYFLSKKMFLVNLDYMGRGAPFSYLSDDNNFGVLLATEAVYLRNIEDLILRKENYIIKAALFLFLNSASDVALFLLKRSIGKGLNIPLRKGKLVDLLKHEFCHVAYPLKNCPGDRFIKAKKDFQKLFDEPFPDYNNFYELNLLNPT